MNKAPEWFTQWNETSFKPLVKKVDNNTEAIKKLDAKVDNLEVKVDNNTKAIKTLSSKITNIVELNNLKE